MKRKLVLTSAVVLILALLAAGTFAYFTKNARATNVITTGTISIVLNDEIKDTGAKPDGTGWKLEGVMPGQAVHKAVSVTNNGTAEAWLRVKLDVSVTVREDGETIEMDRWISVKGQDQPVLQFDVNPDWFPAKDENGVTYYYYSKPVPADAGENSETAELFKDGTLMLNPQLPNDYQGCTVTVAVQAQAVQVKNNDSYTDGDKTVTITTLTPENVDKIADTFPAAD